MKKLCSVVAAGAMVAASIVPAFAADVDWSGEVRVRYENKNNYDLDKDKSDLNSVTTQRTTINGKVAIDDQTTGFVSLRDARTWGSETSTAADDSGVGLTEAYLDIKNVVGPIGMKIGRQKLAYGNQRLIGHLEWSDAGRRFDALKLTYRSEPVDVDYVASKLSANGGETDDQLNILYATLKVIPMNVLDVYAIEKIGGGDYTNSMGWTVHNNEDFLTTGLRLAGKAAGADWTAEVAQQAGDAKAKDQDKDADAWAVTAGYTIPAAANLRIGVQAFSGSGQDTSTDDTAFDNLYPTNHFHYGISDFGFDIDGDGKSDIGTNWTNNTGTAVQLSAKPAKGLVVKAEYWMMETTEDVAAAGNDVVELTETNVQVKYALTEKTGLYFYYSIVDVDANNVDEAEKIGLQLAAKF